MSDTIIHEDFLFTKFSTDDGRKILNHGKNLKEHLSEAGLMLDGLYKFFQAMRNWQTKENISPEEFDRAYIFLCKAGLVNWLNYTIDPLYYELTGQELEEESLDRLCTLEDEYLRKGVEL